MRQPGILCGQEDGWDTEPFVLTEKNGKLYGRGATDDKGPVLGWIHALQAYQECGIELPVNFKFCFEGMEESGSEGLDKLLMERYARASVHLYFCQQLLSTFFLTYYYYNY
jgi:nonspecific dipeptidase